MFALAELELDALAEIFNLGMGLAADVLSQMVKESVRLSVPHLAVTDQQEAAALFHERDSRPMCAIRQRYTGEISTEAILMFPEVHRLDLVRSLVGPDVPLSQVHEMAQDAMAEIGNVILNAVISQWSSSLNLPFEGSLPEVSLVAGDRLFQTSDQAAADPDNAVLMLTIDFELSHRQINGYLAFLLDLPSCEGLAARLGQYIHG